MTNIVLKNEIHPIFKLEPEFWVGDEVERIIDGKQAFIKEISGPALYTDNKRYFTYSIAGYSLGKVAWYYADEFYLIKRSKDIEIQKRDRWLQGQRVYKDQRECINCNTSLTLTGENLKLANTKPDLRFGCHNFNQACNPTKNRAEFRQD